MLDNLRKNASGWLAKILIALLIVSFAAWGIADQFTGGNDQVLVRVAGEEIPLQQFRTAYQNRINTLSRQTGHRVTAQEARAIGLPDQVLNELVNGALLDAHARSLGLGVSREQVTRSIVESPMFHDASGEFSRAIFERALQFTNLSEAALLAQQRGAMIRSQLAGTIGRTPEVPDTLVSAVNRYRNETRVIAHFNVGADAVAEPPEPADSELRSYYEENTGRFMAPETRNVAVLNVTPQAVAGRVDITDEQVRADYDARRDQYIQPERRDIRQIIFPDMAAARKGYQALQSGTDFMEVAKQQGMSESDTELGTLTKGEISDSKIAGAAFSLEKGAYSQPVKGRFATVILKVTDIHEGKSQSFADVKDQIRKELTGRAAVERILDLRDSIEDKRAAGAPLSEIAEQFDLPYMTITLDRSGDAPDGSAAAAPADLARFRSAVFASDVGLDEKYIEGPGEGLIWYEVLGITPATERPFDEVKEKVKTEWRAEQLRKAVVARADKLAEQARAGKSMRALAGSIGANLSKTDPVKRSASVDGLSSAAVGQAFTLPRDGIGTARAPDGPAQTVFQVTKITEPEPVSGEEAEQLRSTLKRSMDNDLTQEYVAGLRNLFDTTVNRAVLRQTLGL